MSKAVRDDAGVSVRRMLGIYLAVAVAAFGFVLVSHGSGSVSDEHPATEATAEHVDADAEGSAGEYDVSNAELAAWVNCGAYTCTQYMTRTETRAVARYLNSVGGPLSLIGAGICALMRYTLATAACVWVLSNFDFRGIANSAVSHNACLQLSWRNTWWGKLWPAPGETNHPSYCFN